ncbi:MAG: ATPase P [Verrucomicrobia bacterium SCN 57-15]|nr:MAG: ATPase P [Verrucomicrobia bacterium SCN 57-15]
MLKSITLEVVGDQKIVCDGCEQRIEKALKGVQGVNKVRADARNQRIDVLLDTNAVNESAIAERIGKVGYQTKIVSPV